MRANTTEQRGGIENLLGKLIFTLGVFAESMCVRHEVASALFILSRSRRASE
jgi:hypothetical protein